jgi:hypothetical protein
MKIVVLLLSFLCIMFLSATFLVSPYRGELEVLGIVEKNPGGALVGFIFSLCAFFISTFNLLLFRRINYNNLLLYLNIVLVIIAIIRVLYWAKFLEG